MGCDIQYFLDHDFTKININDFLEELKKRIAPVQLYILNDKDDSKSLKDLGIKECWSIYFEGDEHNLDEASISYYKEDEKHWWKLYVYKNTMNFCLVDKELTFSSGLRWSFFRDDYLKNRSPEIKSRIDKTIEEVKKYIVPVFHSTKLVAMGDQGLYEILEDDLTDGATFDEAYNSKQIRDEGYYVELYYYGSTRVLSDYKNRLPIFECDLTVERPDKFWIKVVGVIDLKERRQLIYGESNDFSYDGKIQCEGKSFKIIGREIFRKPDDRKTGFLLDTHELTKDCVGKVFDQTE